MRKIIPLYNTEIYAYIDECLEGLIPLNEAVVPNFVGVATSSTYVQEEDPSQRDKRPAADPLSGQPPRKIGTWKYRYLKGPNFLKKYSATIEKEQGFIDTLEVSCSYWEYTDILDFLSLNKPSLIGGEGYENEQKVIVKLFLLLKQSLFLASKTKMEIMNEAREKTYRALIAMNLNGARKYATDIDKTYTVILDDVSPTGVRKVLVISQDDVIAFKSLSKRLMGRKKAYHKPSRIKKTLEIIVSRQALMKVKSGFIKCPKEKIQASLEYRRENNESISQNLETILYLPKVLKIIES